MFKNDINVNVDVNIDFDPYDILGLEKDPEIPINIIKKQFYKLSLQFHPDRLSKKSSENDINYQNMIIAYNILSDSKKRLEYHKHFPSDHYQLSHSSKALYKVNKKTNKKINLKKFNLDFLKKIKQQDAENLQLFVDLSLNPNDIENQFKILHPETKFETNYKQSKLSYDNFKLEIENLIETRNKELIKPTKLFKTFDNTIFNNYFCNNKRKSQIIKYETPEPSDIIKNNYIVNSEKFRLEYELPSNPDNKYNLKEIDHQITKTEKISLDEFDKKLKDYINNRDLIYKQ